MSAPLGLLACTGPLNEEAFRRFAKPLAGREWSGAIEAPEKVSWKTRIDEAGEPGEPLVVSGTIFKPDGNTPAAGVLLYVYHTDAKGYYSRGSGSGNGRRHGKLRGWMLTGSDGKFEFRTIRPAHYPGRTAEAHIHATLTADGFPEHYVDEFLFEGDPLLPAPIRDKSKTMGEFAFVMALERDREGIWRGRRNIRLEAPSAQNGGR